MKREQKHLTYLRLIPHLIAEMKKAFDNDRYRNSPTYVRVLAVTQRRGGIRMDDIGVIESELTVIIAFAKLKGHTDLERYARQIIKLF
jgi:hypothetical protein